MRPRASAETVRIREHIEALKGASWLGPTRRWWPGFLFHCTDILNIVNILKSGELLSRVQAKASNTLEIDIASSDVIARTALEWQDYVRLYFRPKTPTQYNNEGFRPRGQWALNSHCPVPICLLFDSIAVLSRADSLFTDGNVGAGAQPSGIVDDLQGIPFRLVYHDTWFEPDERGKIVYHRNAEVLVPQRLGLDCLRAIICRSQAEYETLLYLLPPGIHSRWVDQISVRQNLNLFNNRWTFVEQVDMSNERVAFRFNRSTTTPGPFVAYVEIFEPLADGPKKYTWQDNEYQAKDALSLNLRTLTDPSDYSVRLTLDGQLAFANRYQEDRLPF